MAELSESPPPAEQAKEIIGKGLRGIKSNVPFIHVDRIIEALSGGGEGKANIVCPGRFQPSTEFLDFLHSGHLARMVWRKDKEGRPIVTFYYYSFLPGDNSKGRISDTPWFQLRVCFGKNHELDFDRWELLQGGHVCADVLPTRAKVGEVVGTG